MRLKLAILKRHFDGARRAGRGWQADHGAASGGDRTYTLLAAIYLVCEAAIEGGRPQALQRLCRAEPEPSADFDHLFRTVLVACGIEDRRTRYKLCVVARWACDRNIKVSELEREVRAAGGLNACAAQRACRKEEDVQVNSWL